MANRVLWIKSLAVVAVAAGLVACGGSRSAAPFFTSDTTVNATAAAYSGMTGTYTFGSGVAAFGTTTTTDVAFGGTPAAPTFTIGSGGATASGDLAFGSCIFTVKSSSFAPPHPLAAGQTITINPCTVNYATAGVSLTGNTANILARLFLGVTGSTQVSKIVQVLQGGGGIQVGSVVVSVSGSSGSGN
jgi:hypothetical protein